MKKQFLAVTLALALCMGLAVPAFASDISSATQEDIKSTFTILRNGTTDETEGLYRCGTPVTVDDNGEGGEEIYYHYVSKNDRWTITNTGSKTISASGTTDYRISFATWEYVNMPGEGFQWVGGLSTVTSDGRIIHYTGEDGVELASLKAGESVTIGPMGGDSNTIQAISICLDYGPDGSDGSLYYNFYFLLDEAQKAAIDEKQQGTQPEPIDPPAPTFSDVPEGEWYAAPVSWALGKDITNGTDDTHFSPDWNCTQAQILTFLYRAARGEGKAAAEDMDLAVAWAKEKGIIGDGFDGAKDCTRSTAVDYIWRAFDKPEAEKYSFNDVDAEADYADAVSWAVANGVTNGTDEEAGLFSPDTVCTRGHIVTFLHRAYVEEARLTVEK